jgi:hypothetical protein
MKWGRVGHRLGKGARMAESDSKATWPEWVSPISYGNMNRLGVGVDGYLYWDGKPLEIKRRLKLSNLQLIGALVVGLATFIGGAGTRLNEGFDFGCKVHWWTDGCKP